MVNGCFKVCAYFLRNSSGDGKAAVVGKNIGCRQTLRIELMSYNRKQDVEVLCQRLVYIGLFI